MPSHNPFRWMDLLFLAALLFYNLILYRKVIFYLEVPGGGDLVYFYYIWKDLFLSCLRAGEFPFWNPYPFCGTPFFHELQAATLYLPDWLFFLIPIPWGFGFSYFLHTLFAGITFYFLAGDEIEDRRGRLLSAILYMSSGYVASRLWTGQPTVTQAYSFIPLFFLLGKRLFERPNLPRLAAFGFICGIFILTGHPQLPYLAIQLLGIYLVFRVVIDFRNGGSVKTSLGGLACVFLGGMLGLGLTAVQVGPFLEYASYSATRAGGASYDFAAEGSMPIHHLVTLAIPFFFGDPTRETFWSTLIPYQELCGYLGLTSLFLVLAAWIGSRRQTKWFWLGICLASLLVALGDNTPVHWMLYKFVPGWDRFRQPSRTLVWFTFAGSLLAGMGFDSLRSIRREGDRQYFWLLIVLTMTLFALVLGLGLVLTTGGGMLERFASEANLEVFRREGSVAQPFQPENFAHRQHEMVTSVSIGLGTTVLALLLVVGISKTERWRPVLLWIFVLIGAADLLVFGDRFLETWSRDEWAHRFLRKTEVSELLNAESEKSRVLIPDTTLDYRMRDRYPELYPNGPMFHRIRTVRGYNPTILVHYSQFINMIQGKQKDEPPGGLLILDRVSRIDKLALEAMGVGSVLSFQPLGGPFLPEKKLDSGLLLYRYPKARSRCFRAAEADNRWGLEPVDDEKDDTHIIESSMNHLVAETEGPGRALLVFSDCWFPGWTAEVNGERRPIEKAFHAFQAVEVPPGKSRVVWRFRPTNWGAYIVISSLSLAILILISGVGLYRKTTRP